MKLNEKGWDKAKRYLCLECWKDSNWERPNEPEFESEDFKPEVQIKPKEPEIRLSVEEAKGICSIIACFIMGEPRNLEDYKGFDAMNKQILQIEEVEGSND